ncbi:MAG TPA: M3 family metallopeptidase [Vicinamibacteria bacterium]|nr:M3 family metallopeptidase [Vicinamibacteria bacterium]
MPSPLAPASLAALLAAAGPNPLLAPWTGPYGGAPALDRIKVEDFKPALEAGMAAQLAAVDAITATSAPPTFSNTIGEMERSDRLLKQVRNVYETWSSTMSSPEFQAVEREMAPRLAAFRDAITQNEALFRRITAVYEARESAGLTPEQKRLAWLYYTTFARTGAKLDPAGKKRLSEINQRLAALYTDFAQNVLADENDCVLFLGGEKDLAGLPDSVRSAAAAAAESRGKKGQWAILNTRSSMEPFLTYSERRDLREKVWRTYYSRGDNGDAKDNKKAIAEILALRDERARLLGFPSYAHWSLEDTMAKTPERAMALMEAVWTPAVARVKEEVAEMQAIADREGPGIRIAPWDYRYYAEKVRKARFDLDEAEVKPYLQLERLREGMFWVAGEVFGLHFSPVQGVPVCHPDVVVYEVKDDAGRHVGLWYFDPWARPGKRSGAWMSAYRDQESFDGEIPTVVSNNANFVKAADGEPVLVSWDDAETMFHEFGHALHGLSSSVGYPSLSGTSVARDYVEFPSQLLERWLQTPEVLSRFALHYRTGQPMPKELARKIERASTFRQGFDTVEYLASALVDMKLHLAGARPIDPDAFERETLAALGMPPEIVMRHRTPQFTHVFSGEDYAAGYYAYLWSDVLAADAWEAFTEAGGPYDRAVARRLRESVFSVGNTIDPADGYRAFRGRDARIDALMRKRGFPVPAGND